MKNNKSLGQHWLKNRVILDKIADLALVKNAETICIEIGPGLGTLTSSLLHRFREVIAIEYDPGLARNLPKSFPGKSLTVINDDILRVDLSQLVQNSEYIVVGNIPYYITSPIIKKLLLSRPAPKKIALLIQKEVAERITAQAGSHSALSVFVQSYAVAEAGPVVKAAEFTPPPKVDSQVLILTPLETPTLAPEVLSFVKKGFTSPRKKLAHNLSFLGLTKAQLEKIFQHLGLDTSIRAQDLSLSDWHNLYQATHSMAFVQK